MDAGVSVNIVKKKHRSYLSNKKGGHRARIKRRKTDKASMDLYRVIIDGIAGGYVSA